MYPFRLLPAVVALAGLAMLGSLAPSAADEFPPKGKSLFMLIGSSTGGGTDAAGRLIAKYLGKHLPGEPNFVIQNMPGAGGMTALNHLVLKTQPDGLTVVMGSATQVDPISTRKAAAKYDPTKFRIIGGIGRGGSALVIKADVEKRLYDKSAAPVIMGSFGSFPRQGMQVVLWCVEYLGWNVKWVSGYPGTNELMLALDRGEVDMTSTGNIFAFGERLKKGELKILNQAGMVLDGKHVGRQDFGDAPLLAERMEGKIKDQLALKSFDYWIAMNTADKWLALAPGTPDNIVEIYRQAFTKMSKDKEFLEAGEKISDGFVPTSHKDVEAYIQTLADTSDEAINYTTSLMRKQGIAVELQ
jgi:tripartite-type tricarboxylate transporter receptor subunit TctC